MGGGYSLPPVALKKRGEFDADLLRQQKDLILKGLISMDDDFDHTEEERKKDSSANKSVKEKSEDTDKILESTKTSQ